VIKAVIFDCFGVLVGTGLWQIFERAGGDIEKDGAYLEDMIVQASAGKLSSQELTQSMADRIGVGVDEYRKIIEDDEQPNTDVFSFIETELKPAYKIGLLSNATHGEIERKIPQEMRRLFDAEILSAEVGMQKPDVRIFKLAAERLAVDPNECVFIDDREHYLEGATRVGMQTILYKDFKSFKNELERALS